MRGNKLLTAVVAIVAAVGLTALGAAAYAAGVAKGGRDHDAAELPSSGKSGISPQDYLEISQLYGLYARDVDPGSPRDASWLVTEDGSFTSVSATGVASTFEGREALREFYQSVRATQSTGTRHYNTTYVIQRTDEGALASGYMLTVARAALTEPWVIRGSGVYEDHLVKTRQGWRFQSRVFHNDSYVGDPNGFPTSPLG
jgi:hypothetical protein